MRSIFQQNISNTWCKIQNPSSILCPQLAGSCKTQDIGRKEGELLPSAASALNGTNLSQRTICVFSTQQSGEPSQRLDLIPKKRPQKHKWNGRTRNITPRAVKKQPGEEVRRSRNNLCESVFVHEDDNFGVLACVKIKSLPGTFFIPVDVGA